MAKKYKYTAEFEINASPKMIYTQVATVAGLREWFAENVVEIDDKHLDIMWDGNSHPAKIMAWRTNANIKYRFLPTEESAESSTLEFKIEFNEMTQTTFLRVIDYSDMDNEEELNELWGSLVDSLKESLGDAS